MDNQTQADPRPSTNGSSSPNTATPRISAPIGSRLRSVSVLDSRGFHIGRGNHSHASTIAKIPTGRLIKNVQRQPISAPAIMRSEEHTSELQSRPHLVCRLLLEKKKN